MCVFVCTFLAFIVVSFMYLCIFRVSGMIIHLNVSTLPRTKQMWCFLCVVAQSAQMNENCRKFAFHSYIRLRPKDANVHKHQLTRHAPQRRQIHTATHVQHIKQGGENRIGQPPLLCDLILVALSLFLPIQKQISFHRKYVWYVSLCVEY